MTGLTGQDAKGVYEDTVQTGGHGCVSQSWMSIGSLGKSIGFLEKDRLFGPKTYRRRRIGTPTPGLRATDRVHVLVSNILHAPTGRNRRRLSLGRGFSLQETGFLADPSPRMIAFRRQFLSSGLDARRL